MAPNMTHIAPLHGAIFMRCYPYILLDTLIMFNPTCRK